MLTYICNYLRVMDYYVALYNKLCSDNDNSPRNDMVNKPSPPPSPINGRGRTFKSMSLRGTRSSKSQNSLYGVTS